MRDHGSGSGPTANRINQLNASGLYPASDKSSCSPQPALCYRPSLALSPSFCNAESDFALAADAAPSGKTSEAVKERVLFTPFIAEVNIEKALLSVEKSIGCTSSTAIWCRPCAAGESRGAGLLSLELCSLGLAPQVTSGTANQGT